MMGMAYGKQVGFFCLLLGASLLLCPSCKKQDHDAPSVALSRPADGNTVIADSNFIVEGIASDDQGLSSITAILYASISEEVVASRTVPISGLKQSFSFEMSAGDRYTAAGEYALRVTAVDLAGNHGAAFTQINVQALPLAYWGVAWAGDQGGGSYALHWMDTAGVVHAGPAGIQRLVGMFADNRSGQLVAVQTVPGILRAWDWEDFSPLFQVDLPQGTGSETFAGLSMEGTQYFAALKVPPYLRSYRNDGAPINDTEEALHPGTAILATKERVYMGLEGIVGIPLKLDAYDAAGENLLATQLLDWAVEEVLELNADQLLVCGNLQGQGKILVLDRQSLQRDQETDAVGTFVAAATANGRAWILTDQGVYEYFATNGTLSAALVTGNFTALGVDATRNQLFLGGMDQVGVYSGAGALLTTRSGSYGTIKFIDTRYNK
jgi:hypothetical protein